MHTIYLTKIPEYNLCKDSSTGVVCPYLQEESMSCRLLNALQQIEPIDYTLYKTKTTIACSYCLSRESRSI